MHHEPRWRSLVAASLAFFLFCTPALSPVYGQETEEIAIEQEATSAEVPSEEVRSENAEASVASEGNEGDTESGNAGTDKTEPDKAEPDETESAPTETSAAAVTRVKEDHPLATSQWRQRKPRWIAVYGSQLADMIPQSFRPISIEDLAAALRDAPQSELRVSPAPVQRLAMIARVHENHLISERSTLLLPGSMTDPDAKQSSQDSPSTAMQRYRLGPLNLSLINSNEGGQDVVVVDETAIGDPDVDDTDFEPVDAKDLEGEVDSLETGTSSVRDRALRPRIVSDVSGDCFALGRPGETIDFRWTARCTHVARGRRWQLRLPEATVTRFWVSVHPSETLEVDGGSIVPMDRPPTSEELGRLETANNDVQPGDADADDAEGGSDGDGEKNVDADDDSTQEIDGSWYLIEPTPGQTLTLLLRTSASQQSTQAGRDDERTASAPSTGSASQSSINASEETPVAGEFDMMSVVRGCRFQARWMGNHLRWSCRMTLDANDEIALSELAWLDGEVTAVRRDGVEVPFEWTGDRVRWTTPVEDKALNPIATTSSANVTVSFVFEGVSELDGKLVRLPQPRFPDERFLVPPQTWQMQLEVPSWSVLREIHLPDGWNVRRLDPEVARPLERIGGTGTSENTERSSDSTSTWLASGPPPKTDEAWSMTVVPNDALAFANHQIRFEMDETSIQARGKVTVEMPPGAVKPIVMEIQDGFQFEFVGVGEARRSVPTGPPVGRGRRLTIWPGANEIVDNRVSVYVTARARRNSLQRQTNNRSNSNASATIETKEAVATARPSPAANATAGGAQTASGTQTADTKTATKNAVDSTNQNANKNDQQKENANQRPGAPSSLTGVKPPGNRGAAIAGQSIQPVGSLWLIRAVDCPGQLLAAIIPPSNLTWSAKAAIEPSRKAFSDLTAEQRRFFAPLPGDAIVFGGAIEVTPEVSLEKPDINLSVSLRTLLRGGRTMPRGRPLGRDNNPDESPLNPLPIDHVWQTLEVKTEGTAGEIRSMRLRFAADHGEPAHDETAHDEAGATQSSGPPPWSEMQWAVQIHADAPEFAVDEELISRQFIDGVRAWEVRVALPPRFTNQSLLIGRRRQDLDPKRSNLTIGLPHVPDAASQSAEVWIDPSLQLKQHFDSLKGVPTLDSTKVGRNEPALSTRVRWSRRATSTSETARYRYEPNDRPWIEVIPRQHHSPTGLIVSKRLTAVASVNGTDLFQLDCLVRSNAEMELTFPMSLQLVEVRRDGVLITPRLVPGRGVILPPPAPRNRGKSNPGGDDSRGLAKGPLASQSVSAPRWSRLQVNWISPATRGSWYRWFQFPEIHLDQLVVDARRELLAATGTNVVQFSAAPWGAASMSAPLLLPAGFLSSLGWVIAFVLLGLARLVGSRGLPTIAASIVLALSASLLWPSSTMPLVAFVALPLTLAALQLATTGWNQYRQESDSSSQWASRPGSIEEPAEQLSSPEFSSSRLSLGDETTARRANAGALHRTPPVPPSANDSWTRKFEAGEILSSELHSDGIIPNDGSSQQNDRSRGGSDDDFSSSSIVPLLIACVCTLSALFVGGNAAAQVLPGPPVASGGMPAKDAPPVIDVLVPLKSDGAVLGNKIYIPEAFYNELFFRDRGSEIQTPMIERVAYEVKLASPLQSNGGSRLDPISRPAFPTVGNSLADRSLEAGGIGNVTSSSRGGGRAGLTAETLRQSGAAKLTARIGVVLPPESRRLRLPYRFEQVLGVARVQSGVERQTLRWGDDGEGWVWVEMPSSERDLTALRSAELLLSLQCEYEWEDPWVLISAKLPPLSVAQLNVAASDSVDSVMLQNSTSSWVVDLRRKLGVTPVIPTASTLAEPDTQYSGPVHLGPVDRLQLRYQFRDVATEAASSSGAMLPWDDERYWQKRFWVHSQSGKTVIECEVQPRRSMPPEAIVMMSTSAPEVHGIELFDEAGASPDGDTFDASPTCKLLTQHWSRQPIKENAGDRSLRLMSLTTPTRPIRLGWTLTTPREGVWRIRMPRVNIGAGAFATQGPRSVPVITPEELGGFGEDLDEPETTPSLPRTADESLPWVAWTFSDDLQPDWSQIGGLEPLAVDQFYAKWTGYLSSINRAAVGTVTDLTLKRIAKPRTPLITKHEVTIEKESQRVEFFAEIRGPSPGRAASPASVGSTRYAVHLPPNARLLDWKYEPIGDESGNGFGGNGNPSSETGSGEFANASGGDPSGDVEPANISEESKLPVDDANRQPWTVSQQGNVTTLLLTSDREGFRLSVNAMLPINPGKRVNRLPLMRLEKITKADVDETRSGSNDDSFDESHELLITRAIDVVVDWARPVGGQKIDAGVDDAASLLTAGRVVESRYTTNGAIKEAFDSARFRVRRNNRPFDVDSRITLRWDEGRWTAQTDCVITSKYCPDYIDIALPTRWCDSLQIVPLCISSRQPTLDPAQQVLRLELRRDEDAASNGDTNTDGGSGEDAAGQQHVRRFRLISRLAVSEITRVSVPEIRIMDVRRHRIDVVVPTRLTNEQVRWRSNFAGPIAKPRWRIDQLTEDFAGTSANATPLAKPNDSDSNMELSVYAVTSPGWSIDLETLPRTDRVAELIHADHRVLVRPQDERWLMVSRFDILPGDQSSVRLAVPAAAELVGVWAGTRAADLRRIGDHGESSLGDDGRSTDHAGQSSASAQANRGDASGAAEMDETTKAEVIYEVPLPLSRLSQTVEVLIAFPNNLSGLLLPNLLGLSTEHDEASVDWWDAPSEHGDTGNVAVPTLEWLRRLQREAGLGKGNEEPGEDSAKVAPIASRTRLRWLASCVVEAIRSSSDALADRRDEEVAVWLRPWILRYRMLCEAAGRQIGGPPGEASTLVSQDDPRARELANALITEPLLGWEEMDAYILSQETRYFSFDAFLEETLPDLDAATEGNLRSSTPATRLGDLALSGRDFVTTWSDFLAVTTPPGYVDRYTFVWKGRRLPIQMLADRQVPLSEYARQQVLRGGLFIALAGLVLVVALLPRARSADDPRTGDQHTGDRRTVNATGRLPAVNWEHPSLWLFVLSAIGMVLMPIPMAIGLMVAALVLGGSDWSRRWILTHGWWGSKKSQRTQNNGATENPMKSNAIQVDAVRSGSGVRSSGTLKSSRG